MHLLVDADPRYDSAMCQGCRVRRASDVHHMEHKGTGGRKGAAKVHSERPENKIALCRVCHAADHGLRVTEADGFWCGICPRVRQCRVAPIPQFGLTHTRDIW
jgi:hypothetical protein